MKTRKLRTNYLKIPRSLRHTDIQEAKPAENRQVMYINYPQKMLDLQQPSFYEAPCISDRAVTQSLGDHFGIQGYSDTG